TIDVIQKNVATKCPNIQEYQSLPGNPATHWLKLILSGVDGSGSEAACAHPAGLQAVQALADCLDILLLGHFYRPDDRSGTTQSLRRMLGSCNFCNNGSSGTSIGTTNMDNSDRDPIRRACVSAMDNLKPTPCTNGSLGLVVALSEHDVRPGAADTQSSVAISLGRRVANDPFGETLAVADRSAAETVPGAT